MNMNSTILSKCYIIYMEDDHNLRTAVAVCLTERIAQCTRDYLSSHDKDYSFVIEECKLCGSEKVVNK